MSYVTPITDRAASDVDATPTSKGYFNVADWVRIYGNARLMVSLSSVMLNQSLPWTVITDPTVLSFPSVTDFNSLLLSIETTRLAVNIPAASTPIKYDWLAGSQVNAPKYTHVNTWEQTIDAIWLYYDGDLIESCPTLTGNVTVLTGTIQFYLDCVDIDIYTLDIQGTGKVVIL